jgi:hypothetical protein
MAAPRYVLPWRPRKRSTYEQPPDDPAAFFERPPLRRRTTLLSFIGTSADEDPFPGRYYDEPQRISAGHDATIHEIDLLAEAYDTSLFGLQVAIVLTFDIVIGRRSLSHWTRGRLRASKLLRVHRV